MSQITGEPDTDPDGRRNPGSRAGGPHELGGYRLHLRATVAASMTSYGYTLALWTATTVTASVRGTPGTADALALLAGATGAFLMVGALAYGGPTRTLERPATAGVPVWAALHVPAVALSILLSRLLARYCSGPTLWGLVGASATVTYLVGASAQFRCSDRLHGDAPTALAPNPSTPDETRLSMSLLLDSTGQDLLFRQARTANTFTDEPVSDEQVQAIYDLVKFAPTSMNQQPLRIVLVRSDEARARLVQHLADGNRQKTETAPLVAILAADNEFHEELPRMFPHFPQAKDLFFSDRSVRERSARFNAALQVGYFILGVRAAGLAAGPMTGFDAEGIDKEFFGDGRHSVLAVINMGRPGENAWFGRSPRLRYDQVVTTV